MSVREALKPSRIYPLVVVLLMIVVWNYRQIKPTEQKPVLPAEEYVMKVRGKTMGTYYDIRYIDKSNSIIQPEIDSILIQFSMEASTWLEESEISQFNLKDTLHNPSSHLVTLIKNSNTIYNETNGAFDPTVGPLVNSWGFGEKYHVNIPTAPQVDSMMQYVGFNKIHFDSDSLLTKDKGVYLNLSAIAKGYGCDIIAEALEKKGFENYKVEIGGEVVCKGTKNGEQWRIGVEKPAEGKREIHTIIKVGSEAMATSGNYRNYFEHKGVKYAHTINPVTGHPIQLEVLSASVIAKNCMIADAYATSFMVMGLENIKEFCKQRNDIEVFIIYEEEGAQKVWMTEGMRSRILI